jgi:hypothetical protein
MKDAKYRLVKRLRLQSENCRFLGSELYAHLLGEAADDAEAGGPTLELMEPYAHERWGVAVGLKLMGAVHRLVLQGEVPELARYYPNVGGTLEPDGAWPALRAVLIERHDDLVELVRRPVQTNEPCRAAALLGGFLEVARATGLPLRVLEIGASAGLILRWDHYRYESDNGGWGPKESPVRMAPFEATPDLTTEATVVDRAGCDPDPIDPTSDEGRLTLRSYVWPDQGWRWQALQGALEVAVRVPVSVEKSGAAEWLERMLAERTEGRATIVLHSIVLQYLEAKQRERVEALLHEAGKRATRDAPLARLSLEPPEPFEDLAHVRLTRWPRGDDRLVARAGYHGRPVIWTG